MISFPQFSLSSSAFLEWCFLSVSVSASISTSTSCTSWGYTVELLETWVALDALADCSVWFVELWDELELLAIIPTPYSFIKCSTLFFLKHEASVEWFLLSSVWFVEVEVFAGTDSFWWGHWSPTQTSSRD